MKIAASACAMMPDGVKELVNDERFHYAQCVQYGQSKFPALIPLLSGIPDHNAYAKKEKGSRCGHADARGMTDHSRAGLKYVHESKLCRLGSNTQSGGSRVVKDNVLALKEDIAKDVDPNPSAGLQPTEASRAAVLNRSVVKVAARHNSAVAAETESQARERSRAREDVAAIGAAVLSTRDLAVVGGHDSRRAVDKSGPSVGNCVNGRRCE